MGKRIYKINNSGGLIPDSFEFGQNYKLISKKKYLLLPTNNTPVYMGDKNNKKCCFCGKTDSEVSFSQLIDALPAFLGNRLYYSHEECDECNQKYGKLCENELSKMLAPEKAIFSIPSRAGKKVPKHKKVGASAFIGGSEYINNMVITVAEGDDSIKTNLDEENKKVTIETFSPPYNPTGAVKSLMRSVWFCLKKDERNRNKIVLDQITTDKPILPITLAKGIVPGGDPSSAELCIYELIDDKEGFPSLVCTYRIGQIYLAWPSPDKQKLTYSKYFPLPDILAIYDQAPPPSVKILKILKDEKIRPTNATFEFSFEGLSEGGIETIDKPKRSEMLINNEHQVRLWIENQNGSFAFENLKIRYLHEDETGQVNAIEGKDFGVKLQFSTKSDSKDTPFKVIYKWEYISLDNAIKTIDFMLNLEKGSSLYIENLDTNQKIEVGKTDIDLDDSLKYFKKYAEALSVINNHFSKSYKLPNSIVREDYQISLLVSSSIKKESIKFADVIEMSVSLEKSLKEKVLSDISNTGIITMTVKPTFLLFNDPFELENVNVIMKILDKGNISIEDLDEEYFQLVFEASEYVYLFGNDN